MAWYTELARWILPRPTPTPAGDKPPRYIPITRTTQVCAFGGIRNKQVTVGCAGSDRFVSRVGAGACFLWKGETRVWNDEVGVGCLVPKGLLALGCGAERSPNLSQARSPAVEQKEGAEYLCR